MSSSIEGNEGSRIEALFHECLALRKEIEERFAWAEGVIRLNSMGSRLSEQFQQEEVVFLRQIKEMLSFLEARDESRAFASQMDIVLSGFNESYFSELSLRNNVGEVYPNRSSIQNYFSRAADQISEELAELIVARDRRTYDDQTDPGRMRVDIQDRLQETLGARESQRLTQDVMKRLWVRLEGEGWRAASDESRDRLSRGEEITFESDSSDWSKSSLDQFEQSEPSLVPLLIHASVWRSI